MAKPAFIPIGLIAYDIGNGLSKDPEQCTRIKQNPKRHFLEILAYSIRPKPTKDMMTI